MKIWIDDQEVCGATISAKTIPPLAVLPVDVETHTLIEATNEHGYSRYQAGRAAKAGEPVPLLEVETLREPPERRRL